MRHILIIFIMLIGFANAEQIVVSPQNADYSTIQSAVDNANVSDIVLVESGTYYENLVIKKSISLIGTDTGKGMPVIDAKGQGSAVTLYSDGILLQGFNLTNSGHCGCGNAGIRVESNNNTITGNTAYKNKYGIYVGHGNGNRFFKNDLQENEINAYDNQKDYWVSEATPGNLWEMIGNIASGPAIKGNHYSDFDEPAEGCIDANSDKFCDSPRNISGGSNKDDHPLISI